jgi:FdhD protein
MAKPTDSERTVEIRHFAGETRHDREDRLAVEEPLEIRVAFGPADQRSSRSLSVTMRTPGHDFELAAGFLRTEGILTSPEEIVGMEYCGPQAPGLSTSNIVKIELDPSVALEMERLQRNFFTTSSCGICGKASLDALQVQGLETLDPARPRISPSVILQVPDRLRTAQPLFSSTGGLHAAGLFGANGTFGEAREDVGRHNAVDKVLGRRFLDGETPLSDEIMVVSGRASFEILQKALVCGVPVLVAVGAPSSLAVEMAERFGMTLIGFASIGRFNVYTGDVRMLDA